LSSSGERRAIEGAANLAALAEWMEYGAHGQPLTGAYADY